MRQLTSRLEEISQEDVAGRGLLATADGTPYAAGLCPGHLYGAAEDLLKAARVAIVTGFFVPGGDIPAAETDGPLGAIILAATLRTIGVETVLVTDSHCGGAVRVAGEIAGLGEGSVIQAPADVNVAWVDEFFRTQVPGLTHLISVERVGPSHSLESLEAQTRDGDAPRDSFKHLTQVESRGRTFNMRGNVLDSFSAPLHRLFDKANADRSVRTIGIGDGGNEIGMGVIPWELIVERLGADPGARIACRVATDRNIVVGTSNWGAQALAIAVSMMANQPEAIDLWPRQRQFQALEKLVSDGPCVDGITGKREATVDGLSFERFISVWEQMVASVQS